MIRLIDVTGDRALRCPASCIAIVHGVGSAIIFNDSFVVDALALLQHFNNQKTQSSKSLILRGHLSHANSSRRNGSADNIGARRGTGLP